MSDKKKINSIGASVVKLDGRALDSLQTAYRNLAESLFKGLFEAARSPGAQAQMRELARDLARGLPPSGLPAEHEEITELDTIARGKRTK